jgi:hypothetical protein
MMAAKRMKIANLDEADLRKVQQMEESLSTLIIVLEPLAPLADLTDAQVEILKALEHELGVLLIAYRN